MSSDRFRPRQHPRSDPASAPVRTPAPGHAVLALQRSAGNRATAALLQAPRRGLARSVEFNRNWHLNLWSDQATNVEFRDGAWHYKALTATA